MEKHEMSVSDTPASYYQLQLPTHSETQLSSSYRERLVQLLSGDLDFHDKDSGYASHNHHSFPAKFPPQLPRKFIKALTAPGDVVLDPMMGSGTTVLEAVLTDRVAVGFDIDPLAVKLARVKTASMERLQVADLGREIIAKADFSVKKCPEKLQTILSHRWDKKTQKFVDYWFAKETQLELAALIQEIEKIEDTTLRVFFELTFSAIIITKSGGVSMAFDLAHTRPHKVKVVMAPDGRIIYGKDVLDTIPESKRRYKVKTLRSSIGEFAKKLQSNLGSLLSPEANYRHSHIQFGNAQNIALDANSIDLLVTSPPYASNAIDYMRAHKFSLVWLGHTIEDLGDKRGEYIGGEAIRNFEFETLPESVWEIVERIGQEDKAKGQVLHRYYSEMTRSLKEMYRVVKPGKAAIVVVGTSTMRGLDTQTQTCLAEIGQAIGFEVPLIGVRNLDRNRRMLPAGAKLNLKSQIQQRMHEEYVIGFYKPVLVGECNEHFDATPILSSACL